MNGVAPCGHTHAQIIQSKSYSQRFSSGLDLCFACSPSYHYSLKCRKVQYQALQDKCQWRSNIVYLQRLRGHTHTHRHTHTHTHTQTGCAYFTGQTRPDHAAWAKLIILWAWYLRPDQHRPHHADYNTDQTYLSPTATLGTSFPSGNIIIVPQLPEHCLTLCNMMLLALHRSTPAQHRTCIYV